MLLLFVSTAAMRCACALLRMLLMEACCLYVMLICLVARNMTPTNMPPPWWPWCQRLAPGAGAVVVAEVFAIAVGVVVVLTAATAAPAPTVAVATSSKPNVLFNFMASFLNSYRAIVTDRYCDRCASGSRYTKRSRTTKVDGINTRRRACH